MTDSEKTIAFVKQLGYLVKDDVDFSQNSLIRQVIELGAEKFLKHEEPKCTCRDQSSIGDNVVIEYVPPMNCPVHGVNLNNFAKIKDVDVPDGGLAKDAKPQLIFQRAQIGDIVRIKPEYFEPRKNRSYAVYILGSGEYRVDYVNLSGDGVIVYKDDKKVFLHHDWYTIIKRVGGIGDSKPELTTSELVEMLAKREGVAEYPVSNPEYIYQIRSLNTRDETPNWTMLGPSSGPARILVVTD